MTTSRSEQEMMQLIMEVAQSDDRIRAVLQDGSRANPNVKKDIFQDYDIIYVVTSLAPFLETPNWIDVFGERMILQTPEDMELYSPSPELHGAFSYLMQFMDGNRIDLVLVPVEKLDLFLDDSLCQLLLDKDGLTSLANLAPASDQSYWVEQPSERAFNDCCNEFLYTSAGLAKSIWRQQLPHAKQLFYVVVQEAVMQMLDWHIGCQYDFEVNPGKFGKFYPELLEPELYEEFLSTYRRADADETWEALFASLSLFHETAKHVAKHLQFTYPLAEHQRVEAYLKHVRQLPKDAKGIY